MSKSTQTVEVSTYLSVELADALKRRAAREERPLSAEIRRAIKLALEDDEPAGNGLARRSHASTRSGAGARDQR